MNQIDWSDMYWKKFLSLYRDKMWCPDTIRKYAKWLNLKQGVKVADIGCGLGFLGSIYWKYFGRNGMYYGVDISANLIKEAEEMSKKWAKKGKAIFQVGDAYNLDLKDNSFDMVMCQTLLMHLDKPMKAISEMKRILKPGGTIFCMEPDILSDNLIRVNSNSTIKTSLKEQLINYKFHYYRLKGKKKLKLGDQTIGKKMQMLLFKAGFVDTDVRTNDRVHFLVPPYSEDLKNYVNENSKEKNKINNTKEKKYWRNINRRDVLAGGGSEYLLKQYFTMIAKREQTSKKMTFKQIKKEDFSYCYQNSMFVVKATKKIDD
jgi:ubiquinone/menaquinone biosynthesis C-methylase UbiE